MNHVTSENIPINELRFTQQQWMKTNIQPCLILTTVRKFSLSLPNLNISFISTFYLCQGFPVFFKLFVYQQDY